MSTVLPGWFTKPEVIYSTVLFCIAVAASLWPTPIKRGLSLPGRALSAKARASSLKLYKHDLATLELLHDNSYHLLLWISYNFVDLLKMWVWITVASGLLNLIEFAITHKILWTSFAGGFRSSIFGLLIGR